MSDTRAQAEDRRAQIQARLEGEWRGMDAQVATCQHTLHQSPLGCPYCQRDERLMDLLLAARTELLRLSRVEQALRSALEAARDALAAFGKQAGYVKEQGGYSTKMTEAEFQLARTVSDIDTLLSASPEAQPEEGK